MPKTNDERKITVPWGDFADILQRSDRMFAEEEIRNITLVKPKQLLLTLERKTDRKKEVDNVS